MSDRKGLELLKQITKDPNYAQRVSGADAMRTAGRQWDGRFSFGATIPQYDALNDRFCKFAMRRHLATQRTALKKPGALGQLEPLPPAGQRRLWGTHDIPEAPRGAGAQDPTSFRGAAPAGLQLKQQQQQQDATSAANVEALYTKSKQRLQRLWEELATPDSQRTSFAQQFLGFASTENLAAINDEIQRLLDERNAAMQVEKSIEIREGFLYLLQELTERYSNSSMEKDRAIRELLALVTPFRNSSLDTVDAIIHWRSLVGNEYQPYLWKGVSYLHKMNTDLFFFTQSRLRTLLDFEVANNPLLDPRRALPNDKLPPLRRGAPGVVSKEAAALKDLPKDRLDRAEAVLQEEALRQRALMAPRPDAVLSADEAAHLRSLLTEQQEKDQLVVEEEVWQRAQSSAKSPQQIEGEAATKIQAAYRAFRARVFVMARLVQRNAAVRMQSTARQFLAKLHVERLRKQVIAAKKLQAVQRGISSRSRMAAVRHRHEAAIAIQRVYRGYAARRLTDMLRYVHHCAIAVQRVYRGWRERKYVRTTVARTRNEAATKIQKVFRGHLARRDPRNNRCIVGKTIKLQAWFRGCNARCRVRQIVIRRYAATVIQSTWRGHAARKRAAVVRVAKLDTMWNAFIVRATKAAITIQSGWRMHLAIERVAAVRMQVRQAKRAEAEQALTAAYHADEITRQVRNQAAIKIQALARGHAGRNRFRLITLLNLTAIQIQRVMRGRMGRKRAHEVARRRLIENSMAAIQDPIDGVSPVSAAADFFRQQRATDASMKANIVQPGVPIDEVAKQLGMDDSRPPSRRSSEPQPVVAPQPPPAMTGAETALAEPTPAKEEISVTPHDKSLSCRTTPEATPLQSAEARAATAEEAAYVKDLLARASTKEVAAPDLAPVPAPVPVVARSPASQGVTDAARKNAAAGCITALFRRAVAVAKVAKTRRSKKRSDREARMQECEHAACIIQRWCRSVLSLHAAKSAARSAKANRRSKTGSKAFAQEQEYAARIIQRELRPLSEARSIVKKMAVRCMSVRNNLKMVHSQERQVAAIIIQKQARRWLAIRRHASQRSDRRAAAGVKAVQHERTHAAIVIQSAARRYLATKQRRLRYRTRLERNARRERDDAARIIQEAARVARLRSSERSPKREARRAERNVAADASQVAEREFAATIIQKSTQRKIILPWMLEQRGAALEPLAVQQEAEYAASLDQPSTVGPAPVETVASFAFGSVTIRGANFGLLLNVASKKEALSSAVVRDLASLIGAPAAAITLSSVALGSLVVHYAVAQWSGMPSPSIVVDAMTTQAMASASWLSATSAVYASVSSERLSVISATGELVAAHQALSVDDSGLSPAQKHDMAVEQERSYAASLISRNLSPTKASPTPERATSPVRAVTNDEDTAAQERAFALELIQPVARGFVARTKLGAARTRRYAEAKRQRATVAPAVTTTPPPPPPKTVENDFLSFAPVEATADNRGHNRSTRGRSVSFSSDARDARSRILNEPEVDKSHDADFEHEAAHVHDVNHGEVAQAAKVEPAPAVPVVVAFSSSANASTSDKHHVHFATTVSEAPSKQHEQGAGEESAKPAEATSTSQATAVTDTHTAVTVLNEYELEKAAKQRRSFAAMKIQSAERQKQARSELNRRREQRAAIRSKQQQEDAAVATQAETARREAATDEELAVLHQRRTLAAIRLQCAYRQYNARFMRRWMQERRDEKRRWKADSDYTAVVTAAASRIQRMARSALARMEVKRRARQRDSNRSKVLNETRRLDRAATKIQCAYRCYNARFEVNWRREDARIKAERAEKLRLENEEKRSQEVAAAEQRKRLEERSAVMIQCAYRSYNARFATFLRRQARLQHVAAVTRVATSLVQRVGRGRVERLRLRQALAAWRNDQAALKDQSSFEKHQLADAAVTDAIDKALAHDDAL